MAVVTGITTFNNGDVIAAPPMNTNFQQIKNFVELLSAGSNFDAGAINTEDIANSAITAAKIATGAVTSAKIQSSVSLTTPILGVASASSIAVTGNVVSHINKSSVAANYPLVLADDGTIVEVNSGSDVTITVPADATTNFTVGTQIIILRVGSGNVTVVGASPAVVNSTPGNKLRAQWSSAALIKRDANQWVLLGDLSS